MDLNLCRSLQCIFLSTEASRSLFLFYLITFFHTYTPPLFPLLPVVLTAVIKVTSIVIETTWIKTVEFKETD